MAHPVLVAEGMKNVSAATNLKRRGAVYYCRRRIPQDLIEHYKGKTELAVSLRTRSLREARLRANEQWAQWEAEFAELRRINGAPSTHITELTDEQIQALAAEHYAGWLKYDGEARAQGLSDEDFEELNATVASTDLRFRPALAKGDTRKVDFLAHLALRFRGITLTRDSP